MTEVNDVARETPTPMTRVSRGSRMIAAWGAAVLLAAGTVFWLAGGPTPWEDDGLAKACGGMLAADEVRELFDGRDLASTERPRGHTAHCTVNASGRYPREKAELTVVVDSSADSPPLDGQARAVPLGHGWTGSFALDPTGFGAPSVSVLLTCENQADSGLIVSVTAKTKTSFQDASMRRRLAAVGTETAKRAAREEGCEATPGRRVTDVGLPVADADYRDLGNATGTCHGLLDGSSASLLGVRTVVESEAGRSLNERCVLGGWRGVELYQLTAAYGPYARELRDHGDYSYRFGSDDADEAAEEGVYWTESQCPGGQGDALYRLIPQIHDTHGRTSLALHPRELRSALDAFATASASRHGCDPPKNL